MADVIKVEMKGMESEDSTKLREFINILMNYHGQGLITDVAIVYRRNPGKDDFPDEGSEKVTGKYHRLWIVRDPIFGQGLMMDMAQEIRDRWKGRT